MVETQHERGTNLKGKHMEHKYIDYFDIDGGQLATNMILTSAYEDQNDKLLFVTQDEITGEYRLQSIEDNKTVKRSKKYPISDSIKYEILKTWTHPEPYFLEDLGYTAVPTSQ